MPRIHVGSGFFRITLLVSITSASTAYGQNFNGTFRNLRNVPGLNSQFRDGYPYVTADGLTVYFSSDRPARVAPVDWTLWDIWTATRSSTSEPFGEPEKLNSSVNSETVSELEAQMSADMLSLYFFSGSGPEKRNDGFIWVSERESIEAPWSEPASVGQDVNQLGENSISPAVTRDGLTMFFSSGIGDKWDLFQATRDSTSDPFGNVSALENLNEDRFAEQSPSVSSDGLVLFYETPRDGFGFDELWVATRSSTKEPFADPMKLNEFGLGSNVNQMSSVEAKPFISNDWPSPGSKLYFMRATNETDWDIYEATWHIALIAGDADQDLDFDQLDLVQVQVTAKYLTGQDATWGEGDWNGATGELVARPPVGDGLFNQLDIVAAQQAGIYLAGPYAGVRPNGQTDDAQTSIVYDALTGEVSVDTPAGMELTSINIGSVAGIFTGSAATNLGGSFDNDADENIFKATFSSSFGLLSFGNVAQTGLAEDFLLGDLTVVGSLQGGGALGDVDLVYVPEPASLALLSVGFLAVVARHRRAPLVG